MYGMKRKNFLLYLAASAFLAAGLAGCAGKQEDAQKEQQEADNSEDASETQTDAGGEEASQDANTASADITPEPQEIPDVTPGPVESDGNVVGLSLPEENEQWTMTAQIIQEKLESQGYRVEVNYAGGEIQRQQMQTEAMALNKYKAILVAPVNVQALGSALAQAEEAGIPVVSCEGLVMFSDAVDYYVGFDNVKAGTLQGEYIRDALNLEEAGDTKYIEFFAGDPDDSVAQLTYEAMMKVLQPYLGAGTLAYRDDLRQSYMERGTMNADGASAVTRIEEVYALYEEAGSLPDAVWCYNDSIAASVIQVFEEKGASALPVLTGFGTEESAADNIRGGKQSMTVKKDYQALAEKAADVLLAAAGQTEITADDTETYNNGSRVVPAYIIDVQSVTKENLG